MTARLFCACCLALSLAEAARAQRYEKLSPYAALRWADDQPQVEFDGQWFDLLAINDIPSNQIIDFTRATYGAELWRKRFSEDLVEVLTRMQKPPGRKVSLKLRDPATGAERVINEVEMTNEKRDAIRDANRGQRAASPRAEARAPRRLTGEQIAADLAQLERAITDQYAYAQRRNVPYVEQLAAVRTRFAAGGDTASFAIEIQRLLCRFGDGHSQVRGLRDALPAGFLPFDTLDWEGRVVALTADGQPLAPGTPLLVDIAGLPVERWLSAAEAITPVGSPAFVRRQSTQILPCVRWLAAELNHPLANAFEITLTDPAGTTRHSLTVTLSERRVVARRRPYDGHSGLDAAITYLRIPVMDDSQAFLDHLDATMAEARNSPGLIIDVRGNGGGSRAALRTLFPYFMRPDEPPCVANVAAYRLAAGEPVDRPEGYLDDRWLYPANWPRWTNAQRDAIAKIAAAFKPEWQPPQDAFSNWHYFVLTASDNPRAYPYERPVVVLMDNGCFSATDIFLGALKGRPNITLAGAASGGGSGRARGLKLEHSGVELRLSSMASFRTDGRLYDERGIEPDVELKPTLDDLLGKSDSVLERAQALLKP